MSSPDDQIVTTVTGRCPECLQTTGWVVNGEPGRTTRRCVECGAKWRIRSFTTVEGDTRFETEILETNWGLEAPE